MIRFGELPVEDIVYNNSNCQLRINNGGFARGTLVMTNSEICWKRQDSENGFMIPWEKITVQAITQQPQRCIYFMIDVSWPDDPAAPGANGNGVHEEPEEANNGSEDEGNDSDGSVQELTEFYVLTDAPEEIDELYYCMSKYPAAEPMDDESDDDFFDGDNMGQMNLNEDDNGDRFADAE